ncbi:Calx-beta domain-containing protein [Phenylobacterium sp.]|jgi:hypothetical protein|uniref:Calx-beta domain-containing protein n=1 Tax=Phenylobacterium sp. TaxID=1871053 RepID=UPI002F9472B1
MAVISITAPEPATEGDSGFKTFTFTVTRSGDASAAAAVDYYKAWDNGGPGFTNTTDFGTPNRMPGGTVYFAAGETTKTITIQVAGDTTVEPDESFTIALSNPRGGDTISGTAGRATTTILNDDGAETPPVSNITWGTSSAGVTRQEGDAGVTTFSYVVNRAGDTSGTTTVDWLVRPSSANADDFAGPLSGTITFGPGENSKTIDVQVRGDTTPENDEAFQVELRNAPGATLPFDSRPGRINNDDGIATTPTFAISGPAPAAEGTGGTTPFQFTVTRSGDASQLGMVDWYTVGQTDSAEFSGPTGGTVYFAAGETSKTITLNVVGDSAREGDESFFVGISNPRGGTITTQQATTAILNDDSDTPPMATLTWGTPPGGITQNEGDSGTTAYTYTVNRSGETSGTTTVEWRVLPTATQPGGAASSADDFTGAMTGSLSFAPGETSKQFTVNVAGDTAPEGDEGFYVELFNSPGATIQNPRNPGKIVNDDTGATPPASVSISGPGALAEGDGSNTFFDFTVTRSGDASNFVMVDYWLVGETNAADFTGRTTGTVYFAAGETSKVVRIEVVGDSIAEPDEDFMVGLSNARGATIGVGSAPATILDDDGWVVA